MEPPVPRARKSYSQIAGRRVAGGGALWISTSTIACIGDSARAAAAARSFELRARRKRELAAERLDACSEWSPRAPRAVSGWGCVPGAA